MSTIAQLNVLVTANNEQYMNKMKKSAEMTEEFSLSARGARIAVGQLGEAFGAQGAMLNGVIQSFMYLGPAVGAAVAAIAVFNKVVEDQKKATQEATEFQEKYAKTLHEVRESTGQEQAEGPFSSDATKKIDEINTEIDKLIKKQQEAGDSWFGGGNAIYILQRQIDKLREQEDILNGIRAATESANTAKNQFEDDEYNNKVKNHGHKDYEQAGELQNIVKYEDALLNTLRQLPEGGKEYLAVLKEYRNEHLKELAILDKVREADQKAADEKAKAAAKFEEDIEKQFKASVEADKRAMEQLQKEADKIKEALESPSQKFLDNIKKAVELFDKGLLSADQLNAFETQQESSLDKNTDKEIGHGTFKQIDTSRISAVGLAKQSAKTTVHDPEAVQAINQAKDAITAAIKARQQDPATVAAG